MQKKALRWYQIHLWKMEICHNLRQICLLKNYFLFNGDAIVIEVSEEEIEAIKVANYIKDNK